MKKFSFFIYLALAITTSTSTTWAEKTETEAQLKLLTPNLSPSLFETKLNAPKTAFQFFRSFIPYYYFLLSQSGSPKGTLQPLEKEVGWCLGDAHEENFGTLFQANSQAVFTMNDWDDSGPCPLYSDFLRFLTSTLFQNSTSNLALLVQAYQKGLTSKESPINSPELLSLVSQATARGPVPHGKDFASKTTLVRDELSQEVESATCGQIQEALSHTYGAGVRLLDAYSTRKIGGGSSGLTRYRTLVKFKDRGHQVLELKEMVQPGIFPLALGVIPDFSERLHTSFKLTVGNISPFYQAAQVGSLQMIIRPRWKGNESVQMADYALEVQQNIRENEAAILGAIHAKTASASYIGQVLKSNPEDWQTSALEMSQKFQEKFQELTN